MTDIQEITAAISTFNKERDWDQFHNGKDLSIALSIEASELLELFLWKKPEDVSVDRIIEELADVFCYSFQLAERYNLDVKEIVMKKLAKNAEKYPVEKAKGVATKYNEL